MQKDVYWIYLAQNDKWLVLITAAMNHHVC
jgi:hypothetical protein